MAKLLDLPAELLHEICRILVQNIPNDSGFDFQLRPVSLFQWSVHHQEKRDLSNLRLVHSKLLPYTTPALFRTIYHTSPSFARLLSLKSASQSRIAPFVKKIQWSITPRMEDIFYEGISHDELFPRPGSWEEFEAAILGIALDGFINLHHLEYTGRLRPNYENPEPRRRAGCATMIAACKRSMDSWEHVAYLQRLEGQWRRYPESPPTPPGSYVSTPATVRSRSPDHMTGLESPTRMMQLDSILNDAPPLESEPYCPPTLPNPPLSSRGQILSVTFHTSSLCDGIVTSPYTLLRTLKSPTSFHYAMHKYWNYSMRTLGAYMTINEHCNITMEDMAEFESSSMRCPRIKGMIMHFGNEGYLEWSQYARKLVDDAMRGVRWHYPEGRPVMEEFTMGSFSLKAGLALRYLGSLKGTLKKLKMVDCWIEPRAEGEDGWVWIMEELRRIFMLDETGLPIPGKQFVLEIVKPDNFKGGSPEELLDVFYGRPVVRGKTWRKRTADTDEYGIPGGKRMLGVRF